MGRLTIVMLRVVLAIALAGSLLVQTVLVPLSWADLEGAPDWVRTSIVTIMVLGILVMQVVAVCVWHLLSMVRRGSVFSPAAFRYVNIVIGAIATGAVLLLWLAATLAPGEAVAPGIVGLICGASLVVAGVALVVLVMRTLLAQAVDRELEAQRLRAELSEVI